MIGQGIVEHLFIKKERKKPLLSLKRLNLLQEYGIEGNANSNRHSPRQVLIVNQQDLNELSIPPGELRENVVLSEIDSDSFKPGAKLTFSSGAEIRLTFYCEPCKQVSHLVDSLKSIEQKRGILGVVVNDGEIATGERVIIEPNYFPALSEIPYERFLKLVSKIPYGKVITYKQVLTSIGVDRSYYRVMPLYLKKSLDNYPIHRILDSQAHIISHIPDHKDRLESEGIKVMINQSSAKSIDYFISLKDYAWQDYSLF